MLSRRCRPLRVPGPDAVGQRGGVHRHPPRRRPRRARTRARGPRHQLPPLRPYHPQTCGKVERFHQTLKGWLGRQPRARPLGALQGQLDAFRDYYNSRRPHRALHRRTPADAFVARPKAAPTGTPVSDGHYRIRHDRIDPSGVITLRHDSKLHHIGLGRRLAGTRVLVLVHDLHVRVLSDAGELIRELTLNPRRDYQPQPKP